MPPPASVSSTPALIDEGTDQYARVARTAYRARPSAKRPRRERAANARFYSNISRLIRTIIALLIACALLLLSSVWPPPSRSVLLHPAACVHSDNATSLGGLWQLGKLDGSWASHVVSRGAPERYDDHYEPAGLPLHVTTHDIGVTSPRVIPRKPSFVALWRGRGVPTSAPSGSLHLERPDAEQSALQSAGVLCLTTRAQAAVRQRTAKRWTYEAVVNFLDTPHFGRTWQTMIGRNGLRHSETEPRLPLFALKLAPDLHFWLQAWLEPADDDAGSNDRDGNSAGAARVRLVSKRSTHIATPNTWYHLAVVSDGEKLQLYVNSQLEAAGYFHGRLPTPCRERAGAPLQQQQQEQQLAAGGGDLGDITFGCGMHDGTLADTCSCLLSEVRAVERVLTPEEWLWSATEPLVQGQRRQGEASSQGVQQPLWAQKERR